MTLPVIIILAVVLLLVIVFFAVYNGLVRARNLTQEAFSGIDVQLKKRVQLVPNLVSVAKEYAGYESETLVKVTQLRTGDNTDAVKETQQADRAVTESLKQFRVAVENYPDLKANELFQQLMEELSQIENELAMARRYYNGTTRDLNNKIESFPSNLIAKMGNFAKREFYQVENADDRSAPVVAY